MGVGAIRNHLESFAQALPMPTIRGKPSHAPLLLFTHLFRYPSFVPSSPSFLPSARIVVFDAPAANHQKLPFEERYALLLLDLPPDHPVVVSIWRLILHPRLSSPPSLRLLPSSSLPLLPLDSCSILAARLLCRDPSTLTSVVQAILNDKGEGVVLRRPRSQYDHGRSFSLLKIKVGNKKRRRRRRRKK